MVKNMNLKTAQLLITQQKQRQIKQSEIARAFKTSREYVSKLNKQEHKELSPERIKQLEDYFDVALSDDAIYQQQLQNALVDVSDDTIKEFAQIYSKALDLDIEAIEKLETELQALKKAAKRHKKE